jgi:hypothetical protein
MKITDTVSLSEDALATMLAIVGRTGTGKSYTAKGIVEKLIEARRRLCIVDPTGAWWGLRLDSSGKKPSEFKVIIFGGEHADVPITEAAARPLGKLIGEGSLQCVVDLSLLLPAAQRRFMANFLEALYQANRQPLHLVIDEADEFAPQKPPPEATMCLHQMDRVARRGRVKGIRPLVITQRPAVLNKDVLAMAGTLVSMQLTLGNDRDAIKRWIEGQADPKVGKEVLDSLPKLKRGEGWIWSPGDEVLERVKFPAIRSFDSSSTPLHGDKARSIELGELDLGDIKSAMAAAIDEAKASDPELLRERIAELEAKLKAAEDEPAGYGPAYATAVEDLNRANAEIERLRTRVDNDAAEVSKLRQQHAGVAAYAAELARVGDQYVDALDKIVAVAQPVIDRYHERAKEPRRVAEAAEAEAAPRTIDVHDPMKPGEVWSITPTPRPPTAPERGVIKASSPAPRQEAGGLSGSHQRILNSIAFWNGIGVAQPSKVQVAVVASYTASGGAFIRNIGELRTMGLVDYPADGLAQLTRAGASKARGTVIANRRELHAKVLAELEGPQRRILQVLLDARGKEVGRTELAERSRFEASGGAFIRRVGELKTLGLATYPKKATVQAAGLLFPEGLAP